jgi:hypothetical protein
MRKGTVHYRRNVQGKGTTADISDLFHLEGEFQINPSLIKLTNKVRRSIIDGKTVVWNKGNGHDNLTMIFYHD